MKKGTRLCPRFGLVLVSTGHLGEIVYIDVTVTMMQQHIHVVGVVQLASEILNDSDVE